ncbi:MAG: hypothetical protein V1899_02550 [Planctomycetota bacterium]
MNRIIESAGLILVGVALCGLVFAAEYPLDQSAEVVTPPAVENPQAAAEEVQPDPEPTDSTQVGLPQVIIVPDGEQRLGCWLRLDGSSSRDLKGEALIYEWKQSAGPPLNLSSDARKNPNLWIFFAQSGEYQLSLRAKNSLGWSKASVVKLSIKSGQFALPENEGYQVVGFGERVLLPGEGWRQVHGPPIDLRSELASMFCLPAHPGLFIFEAPRAGDVPERRGIYVPPGPDPAWGDRRPLAEFLAKNYIGQPRKSLLLDASLSHDPDGAEETRALVARWSTPDKQRGAELEPLPGLKARFKAPRSGAYSVSLVVSDGRLDSAPPEKLFINIQESTDAPQPENANEEAWQNSPDSYRDDVRYRTVKLWIYESNLQRAVEKFPTNCGVALLVDAEVAPPGELEKIPLTVGVSNNALMHLIDWIARQTDSCYRRDGNRSLWLAKPLSWAKDEKLESVTVSVDALYEKKNGSDLLDALKPCFQQIVQRRQGSTLAFEITRQELQGVLPSSACARLKEICGCLRAPANEGLPPVDLPTNSKLALRQTLADKIITLRRNKQPLSYFLRDLAELSGVAVGFDPRQFPKDEPRISVEIDHAPLRDAVRTIVDAAGFDGCSVESPGGLWFYRGSPPYESGELLWDHALVRAYDISRLLTDLTPLSGETISYVIQRRIYPESWKDPGALCFYHTPTKKLLVMHGPNAHQKIIEFLHDLRARGEWALGPVEEAPPSRDR